MSMYTNCDGENFSENSHFKEPGDGRFLMRGNNRRKK
jgi:hypothetical protein